MERTKRLLDHTGRRSVAAIVHFLDFLGGSVNLVYATARSVFRPPFYLNLLIEQFYQLGVKSLSLTSITALSTGMVMSLQFGLGLERFGGKLYVPKVVGLSIMRELGPVLTCLMLAGRVGSGIAAEIGSMNVTQQIDAIRALGTDPLKRIVIPRILAMLLIAPLLTVLADIVGIYGGMTLSFFELNIHPEFYFHEAVSALKFTDFSVAFGKHFSLNHHRCNWLLLWPHHSRRNSRRRPINDKSRGHGQHSHYDHGFRVNESILDFRKGAQWVSLRKK